MDPNFNILLMDPATKRVCEDEAAVKPEDKKECNNLAIIIVPTLVGAAIVAGAGTILFQKYD